MCYLSYAASFSFCHEQCAMSCKRAETPSPPTRKKKSSLLLPIYPRQDYLRSGHHLILGPSLLLQIIFALYFYNFKQGRLKIK